eukprot:6353703-Alexandrium_andersonii.AAC.1
MPGHPVLPECACEAAEDARRTQQSGHGMPRAAEAQRPPRAAEDPQTRSGGPARSGTAAEHAT